MTTKYDLVPSSAYLVVPDHPTWSLAPQMNLFQFVNSSNTADPAMWWAESLMYEASTAFCLDVNQIGLPTGSLQPNVWRLKATITKARSLNAHLVGLKPYFKRLTVLKVL